MLRNFEKSYTGGFLLNDLQEYVRCVLWASDPEVLNNHLIRDGKFTLDKLLKKADSFKKKSLNTREGMLLTALKSHMKDQDPVLYSEIIDDHTILLILVPSSILRMVFYDVLKESPDYEVSYVPIPPRHLSWRYCAERYTNRMSAAQKDVHESYECCAVFSYDDASFKYNGDYLDVRRLYDLVMQY